LVWEEYGMAGYIYPAIPYSEKVGTSYSRKGTYMSFLGHIVFFINLYGDVYVLYSKYANISGGG